MPGVTELNGGTPYQRETWAVGGVEGARAPRVPSAVTGRELRGWREAAEGAVPGEDDFWGRGPGVSLVLSMGGSRLSWVPPPG